MINLAPPHSTTSGHLGRDGGARESRSLWGGVTSKQVHHVDMSLKGSVGSNFFVCSVEACGGAGTQTGRKGEDIPTARLRDKLVET